MRAEENEAGEEEEEEGEFEKNKAHESSPSPLDNSLSPTTSTLLSLTQKKINKTSARYCRAFRFQTTFPTLGPCDVTFTSVAGHLFELDFVGEARFWRGVDPASL